jgi:O-antigen/teichoic acid export membrane protein
LNLRANLLANYVGQGWRALMNFAFIPIYVRYLGVEAYGLVGLFTLLQACLTLVDIGMRPTVVREMARFTAGRHSSESIRDLLRSILLVGIAVATAIVVVVAAGAHWLATSWLKVEALPRQTVMLAIAAMGFVIGARLIENVLVGAVAGLQRQVLHNVVTSVMATVRSVGAIAVLVWLSPSITAYFIWQCLISVVTAAVLAIVVHRLLPRSVRPARFSAEALRGVWRFAAGITAITALMLVLTQIDKVLLSRLLTLQAFSVYSIAGAVAAALYVLTAPINAAFNPRLSELVARGDEAMLRQSYHQGAQLVTVVMGPAALMLMLFAERLVLAWTGDPKLTASVVPFVPILALAALLNGLMNMPWQLQVAYGWTRLMFQCTLVAVIILVPAILVLVPRYGAISAAWSGVVLNGAYLVFNVFLMHRRVLQKEHLRWFFQDVAGPLAAAALTAYVWREIAPLGLGRVSDIMILFGGYCACALASVIAAPTVRGNLLRHMLSGWRALRARGRHST